MRHMETKGSGKGWLAAPAVFFAWFAALACAWAFMEPGTVARMFDQGGYSPFELATLPFYAAIIPAVWMFCPFDGSRRRRTALCVMVSVVAAMAIVKELDLHNAALHAMYPDFVGDDGSLLPGLVKPDGKPLTGTPFKARVLTNAAVPVGMKAAILFYFAAFFGTFAAGFAYLLPSWVKGVFALRADAWSIGCFGASGVMVQLADRLPSWLRHAGTDAAAAGADGGAALEPAAKAFCTVMEEGGEMAIAVFALMATVQAWRGARR